MQYTMQSRELSVTFDTHGAEMISLICKGHEMLWQNPNGEWSEHAPVLFPHAGNCAVTVGAHVYPSELHGFAHKSDFALNALSDTSISFCLHETQATRETYPFAFCLTVTYTLSGAALTIDCTLTNTGDVPLPYAFGGHESFVLPRPLGEYQLVWEREEENVSLDHDEDGRLNGEIFSLGRSQVLDMPTLLLRGGHTVIFSGVSSRSLLLRHCDGTLVAQVFFPDFSNVLLWSPDSARTVCIEPWMNLPDTPESIMEEFSEKPGVRTLLPGKAVTHTRRIVYGV